MKYTIDHAIEASVYLWLDNQLVERGSGFANHSGNFTKTQNSPINGTTAYGAPHRQWVYDSSVSGAIVPTGVYVNGTPQAPGTGMQLDFYRGLAVFAGSTNAIVSGAYSYKEVNTYFTAKSEQEVLFESTYKVNTKFPLSFTGYGSNEYAYPCVFIRTSAGENETLCFEGTASTVFPVRLIVLADSSHLYKSITSLLRDAKERHLPIFNPTGLPLNEYNNLRRPFDYSAEASVIQQDANNLAYVKDVSISNFSYKVNSSLGPNVVGGFVDLDLEVIRFPHND